MVIRYLYFGRIIMNNKDRPTYFSLFINTLTLSTFTLGGGYVMIPLLRERVVEKLGWLCEDELTEMTAIGQSSPGAMIINVSVLLGYRLLGFWGAICALFGTSLPAIILLVITWYFYDYIRDNRYVSAAFRGMSAGVSAVIADTVVSMAAAFLKKDQFMYALILVLAFSASWFLDINVAFIIILCGVLGIAIGAVTDRRKKS